MPSIGPNKPYIFVVCCWTIYMKPYLVYHLIKTSERTKWRYTTYLYIQYCIHIRLLSWGKKGHTHTRAHMFARKAAKKAKVKERKSKTTGQNKSSRRTWKMKINKRAAIKKRHKRKRQTDVFLNSRTNTHAHTETHVLPYIFPQSLALFARSTNKWRTKRNLHANTVHIICFDYCVLCWIASGAWNLCDVRWQLTPAHPCLCPWIGYGEKQ